MGYATKGCDEFVEVLSSKAPVPEAEGLQPWWALWERLSATWWEISLWVRKNMRPWRKS